MKNLSKKKGLNGRRTKKKGLNCRRTKLKLISSKQWANIEWNLLKPTRKQLLWNYPRFWERRRGVSKKTKKNTDEKKTQKEKRKWQRGPSGILASLKIITFNIIIISIIIISHYLFVTSGCARRLPVRLESKKCHSKTRRIRRYGAAEDLAFCFTSTRAAAIGLAVM